MKQIEKGEIYQHLSGFLKSKGIELTEGSYSRKIEKSCGLLAETINLSQQGLERAKKEIDEKLDKVRRVIHEKTAPKSAASAPPAAPPSPVAAPEAKPPPRKTRRPARKPRASGAASAGANGKPA